MVLTRRENYIRAVRRTGLVAGAVFKKHQTGLGHPESAQRLAAIMDGLAGAGLTKKLVRIEPRPASEKDLLLCHTRKYVELVQREAQAGAVRLSTGDTAICRESFEVARYAAGGVIAAVDAAVEGRVKNAFCAVRPPGHHATAARGMGFCIFNNAAIGARHALRRHGLRRVLICDWDVHHGNGTQEIFWADGGVMYWSTHLWPWYPGTGHGTEEGVGAGKGCILNFPLRVGAGGEEVLALMEEKLVPAAERFKPEFLVISAGFDSREGDPLGRLGLVDEDFAAMTRVLVGIARKHARGRVVSVLEGGYSLELLGGAVAAHVGALVEA